jgi:ribosome-associated protein
MCRGGVEISSRSRRARDPSPPHSTVTQIQEIQISGDTIRLGQLLKLSGIAESGGEAKALLADGVRVNGVAETRRGRQLHDGDVVEAHGEVARVKAR